MAIHDFHSLLTSRRELSPLFAALRRLSLLDDFRTALAIQPEQEEEEEESFKGWAVWDQPEHPGNKPRHFAAVQA